MNNSLSFDLSDEIERLKTLIRPEERIIKVCFEKGATLYSANDYRQSNKYFSKIMTLAGPDSADYKLAKARLVNV